MLLNICFLETTFPVTGFAEASDADIEIGKSG
jgi:hypothetical protein